MHHGVEYAFLVSVAALELLPESRRLLVQCFALLFCACLCCRKRKDASIHCLLRTFAHLLQPISVFPLFLGSEGVCRNLGLVEVFERKQRLDFLPLGVQVF